MNLIISLGIFALSIVFVHLFLKGYDDDLEDQLKERTPTQGKGPP